MLMLALADTPFSKCDRSNQPNNCRTNFIRGVWEFSESARTAERTEVCDPKVGFKVANKFKVTLLYPNIATDEFGHNGTWTLVYNQGFEVIIHNRKYYSFSDYTQKGNVVTSICNRTTRQGPGGWSHDALGHNWACYSGQRLTGPHAVKTHTIDDVEAFSAGVFTQNPDVVDKINAVQSSWTAKHYPQFEGKSLKYMHHMHGGPNSRIFNYPSPAPVTPEVQAQADALPESFDWRNVSGVSYVTSVKDQGGCGSCYAFGSLGMIEGRLKLLSNNTESIDLSEQDVVSCSLYNQGCAGGFPYLTAGKYAQDYGVTLEANNPYKGSDSKCTTKAGAERIYTASYKYVGGYYGGCNEELMRISLVNDGPLAISFRYGMFDDFVSYGSGIYTPTEVKHDNGKYNPFVEVNHSVLIVGYGKDAKTGKKYWIVKNSWGASWGDHGYFQIERGVNSKGVESIAVEAIPIPY
ncbi:unnamed protein product [Medioppia subpectinata]|uniref:Dipeptidyl peptidase 1 n=1 Tax=Medioppia subpectinata TaxID=1979941 RepID=A0A7R9KLA7_9ACAR|nr:unnamed protein product [Medioppia subpectinata]CAG2104562.1 unnamed protein product [Medioppia subpectinata]